MALYICPDCGSKVSSRIDKCPKCGCPISIMQNQSSENDNSHKIEIPVEEPKIVMEDTPVSVPVEELQKSEPKTFNTLEEPVVTIIKDYVPKKSNNKSLYILGGIAAVLLIVFLIIKFGSSRNSYESENYVVSDDTQSSHQEIIEEKPSVVTVEQNPEADKRLETFMNKLLDEPLNETCKLLKVFKRDNSKSVFFIGNKFDACPQEGPCELCACFYVYDAIKDELRIYTEKNKFDVCSMSELNKVKVKETYDDSFKLDKNVFYIDYSGENKNYFYPSGDDYVLFTFNGIHKIKLSDYSISSVGNPKSFYKVIDDKYIVEFSSSMEMYQGFDFDTATFVVRDINSGNKIANPFFKQETVVYKNSNNLFKLTIQESGYAFAEVKLNNSKVIYALGCKKPSKDLYLYNVNVNTGKFDDIYVNFQLKYIDDNKYEVSVYQLSDGDCWVDRTDKYTVTKYFGDL